VPDDIPEVALSGAPLAIGNLLKQAGLVPSTSEALRMVEQGGVRSTAAWCPTRAEAGRRHLRGAGGQAQVRARHALVWRHAVPTWRDWRAARPVATTVVVFFATLALAKTLDRMVSILSFDLGVHVPLYWVALRSSLEECLELGLSLLLLLGLAQYRAARR
jgi:hypothetical protein